MAYGFRLVIYLFLAWLLTACHHLDPNRILLRQLSVVSVPDKLDAGLRMQAFDFVWSTINERYYDPNLNGVNWISVRDQYRPLVVNAPDDDAFWAALDQMAGEMHDGHTRVESPKEAKLHDRSAMVSFGFGLIRHNDELFVDAISPEGDAWWAGVRKGMQLISINGQDAISTLTRLQQNVRNSSTLRARDRVALGKLLQGEPDTQAAMRFQRPDGSEIAAVLTRRVLNSPPRLISRRLPSGYGYIRFNEFKPSLTWPVIEALRGFHDTPGIIIDLRSNPGGALNMVWQIASEFLAEPVVMGRTLTRSGQPVTLFFNTFEILSLEQKADGRGPYAYKGPLAVLVDRNSASGAEMLSSSLQAIGRAQVVGETSCGCLLGFFDYTPIPGGGRLAYSEAGFVLADGQRVEGIGVVPDKPVVVTVEDLQQDRDRILEAAEALLNTQHPPPHVEPIPNPPPDQPS
ncbi:S41 family peptidase [Chitinivorax sp. B]|uniref:S41 family peptidase n=1 Tax=Chitinivorax sp. B TaxID=2502235 RepID=UPI001484ED37|nr:S41 family peptidase [Chitinivorax sp. B]